MQAEVLIVGGGLAAVRTAQALRDARYTGSILMLSDERELPYDRPPLSKNFLLGSLSEEECRLIKDDEAREQKIDYRLSAKAAGIDRSKREVILASDERIGYSKLVVATGGRPLHLSSLRDHPNVHVLRSFDDARALRVELRRAKDILVVGGGLIGLEVAAVAKTLGANVVVVEAAAVPLGPVVGVELGKIIQRFHERKGVVFRCGVSAQGVRAVNLSREVELSDGSGAVADLVLVGIGTVPNVEWLAGSGLAIDRGLVVDAFGRTDDPLIFGVGDVTSRIVGGIARPSRQWTAATEQAQRVADAVLGDIDQAVFYDDNYFWSDEYGTRIQFAGSPTPDMQIRFIKGGPDEDKFLIVGEENEELKAVLSMGLPRDFVMQSMQLRRAAATGVPGA
jgi:3-phenylpropionate/trans-cinnamate dioxygenase ferredoxin reductase component